MLACLMFTSLLSPQDVAVLVTRPHYATGTQGLKPDGVTCVSGS